MAEIKPVMVNKYDEVVVELEPDGYDYWKVPDDFKMDTLALGDVYRVVAYDDEGYEIENY